MAFTIKVNHPSEIKTALRKNPIANAIKIGGNIPI